MKFWLVIAVLVISLVMLVFRTLEGPTPVTFRGMIETDQFEVRAATGFYRYTVDPRESSFSGIAVHKLTGSGFDNAGIEARLVWLNDASAEAFVETFGPSESCPAGFFNGHARHRLLIAGDSLVEQAIQAWDLPNPERTVHWERFEVRGHCVVGFEQAQVGGEPRQVLPAALENCITMVVTHISRASGAAVY